MGFLDKVRAGAEQAATRAKDEARDFQLRRELNQAYADLGRTTLELIDRGEIAHAELEGKVERARAARADQEAHEHQRAARTSDTGQPGANDTAPDQAPAQREP